MATSDATKASGGSEQSPPSLASQDETAHSPSTTSIELAEVRLRLGGNEILRDVSLNFPAGQITAILGPSGCGKSTLLRLVAGLISPTSGEVLFRAAGQVSACLRPGQLAYVFQDSALMPWRDVRKNVRLPLEILGDVTGQEIAKRVESQLHSVALDSSHWSKYPDELSGGMRMRVSIARSLVTNPEVLLLDEPFSALDDILRRRLGDLVQSLWRTRPRTILLVTHNIDEAILLSHRIIVMGPGKIAAEIPVELSLSTSDDDPRQSPLFNDYYRLVSHTLREAFQ